MTAPSKGLSTLQLSKARPKLTKKQKRYILDNADEFKRIFIGWQSVRLIELVKKHPGISSPELQVIVGTRYERVAINMQRLFTKGWVSRWHEEGCFRYKVIPPNKMHLLIYKSYTKYRGKPITKNQLRLLLFVQKYGSVVNEDIRFLFPGSPNGYLHQRLKVLEHGGWLKSENAGDTITPNKLQYRLAI